MQAHPHVVPEPALQIPTEEQSSAIDQQNIQDESMNSYQALIHQIEQDIISLKTQEQQPLLECQLDTNKTLNITRNTPDHTLKLTLEVSPSIEHTPYYNHKSQTLKNHQPQQKQQSPLQQNNTNYVQTLQLLHQKQKLATFYKQQLQKALEDLQNQKQTVLALTTKVVDLQASIFMYQNIDLEVQDFNHQKYTKSIQELERSISNSLDQKQINTTSTLTITKQEDVEILELNKSQIISQQQDTLKYQTYRIVEKQYYNEGIDSPSIANKLRSELQELKQKYKQHEEQSSNQNSFLKSQIFNLLDQVQNMKIESQKLNSLLIQYEIKLSNNRDFYKVKLVDLQRMVREKTKYLHDLDEEVFRVEQQLRNKFQTHETLEEIEKSYRNVVSNLTIQLQEQKAKSLQFVRILQQSSSLHKSEILGFQKTIEDLHQQRFNQSKYANQIYNEFKQEKNINSDLKRTLQKMWNEIKELNQQYKEKEKECSDLKIRNQFEEEMEEMKKIIDDMSQQVIFLKEEVFGKTEELQTLKRSLDFKEQEVQQYQQQIKLQLYTLQKLRESSEKTDGYIYQLRQQLVQAHERLSEQEGRQTSKLAFDIDSLKSKNLVNELKNMKLDDKNVSFELVLKLIQIIEEYSLDIDNLESQNNQLKKLIMQYERIIEEQISHIKVLEAKEIAQTQNRFLRSPINSPKSNIKLQQSQPKIFRNHPTISTSNSQQQEINIYEELVQELQVQKNKNKQLSFKVKEAHKQLIMYQKQIFEKTEAINYLNLALIKASSSMDQMDGSSSSKILLQNQQLQKEVLQLNQERDKLQSAIQKVINGKNKQIEMLQYQLRILDNNIIPDFQHQNNQHVQIIEHLQAQNKLLLKQIEKLKREIKQDERNVLHQVKSQNNNMNLEEFRHKKCSYLTTLYVILRLCEVLNSTGHVKSIHPEDIYLLGFNEEEPQALRIKLAECGGQHQNGLFTAPQIIKGERQSSYSIAWNFGLILDYILHKEPYYINEREITVTKKPYRVREKVTFALQKLLKSLVVQQKRKRASLNGCIQILQQEINRL